MTEDPEEQNPIDFAIKKLEQLKIRTEFEDRQRGKKRYVGKARAYYDLIRLLKKIRLEWEDN